MTFSLYDPEWRSYYVLGGQPTPTKSGATKYFTKADAETAALFRGFFRCQVVENEEIRWPRVVQRESDTLIVGPFGDQVLL